MPEHLSTDKPARTKEEKIDRQMEDSFPASDPPSFLRRQSHHRRAGGTRKRRGHRRVPEVKAAEKKVHDGDAKTPQNIQLLDRVQDAGFGENLRQDHRLVGARGVIEIKRHAGAAIGFQQFGDGGVAVGPVRHQIGDMPVVEGVP